MAAIIKYYFTKKNIEQMMNESDEKGLSLSFVIYDQLNKYGKNVNAHVEQTKTQRDSKEQKKYFGGGEVVWQNGIMSKKEITAMNEHKPEGVKILEEVFNDNNKLPF